MLGYRFTFRKTPNFFFTFLFSSSSIQYLINRRRRSHICLQPQRQPTKKWVLLRSINEYLYMFYQFFSSFTFIDISHLSRSQLIYNQWPFHHITRLALYLTSYAIDKSLSRCSFSLSLFFLAISRALASWDFLALKYYTINDTVFL